MKKLILVIFVPFFLFSCKPSTSDVSPVIPAEPTPVPPADTELKSICNESELAQIESDIKNTLAIVSTDTDFTLSVKTEDGRELTFNRGASTMATLYESASTSKFISATVILFFIESADNIASPHPLTLDSRPQDFLDSTVWPILATDPLYNIKLRDLLSFTSGLVAEPSCINPGNPLMNFSTCVSNIATANAGNGKIPGVEFYYSSAHLQVAGLMAMKARDVAKGISSSTWQNLFTDFKTKTGLLQNSAYDLPSMGNPRLAGGMHWTGSDYFAFLGAYYRGQILSSEPILGQTLSLQSQQLTDQLSHAKIGFSPALMGIGQDWHYGFGLWLECHSNTFNCSQDVASYSSPGAYGAYPFMNFKNKFYGILARQGAIGTYVNGYALFSPIESKLIKWATKACPE